jgi:hypothetical protein
VFGVVEIVALRRYLFSPTSRRRGLKAPEDRRSPRRFANSWPVGEGASFWTAPVLWRFRMRVAHGKHTPATSSAAFSGTAFPRFGNVTAPVPPAERKTHTVTLGQRLDTIRTRVAPRYVQAEKTVTECPSATRQTASLRHGATRFLVRMRGAGTGVVPLNRALLAGAPLLILTAFQQIVVGCFRDPQVRLARGKPG